MDSAGIGELPDAAVYGDEGSNTIGNIHRQIPLRLPTLRSLGLDRVVDLGGPGSSATGAFGRMAERSPGKDSVTGHWEIAGLVLDRPFPTFPHGFPPEMIAEFERRIGRASLANKVASGTAIIDELGDEHVRTGKPIVYTSADSVFQIAAHEEVVPIATLYDWCEIAYDIAGRGAGIGRVIARPFVGTSGAWRRTANRRDYSLTPFAPTLLDLVKEAGQPVVAIGKIEDLFAGRGVTDRGAYRERRRGGGRDRARDGRHTVRLDRRQPRRFRYPVRPPERCRRIRGKPRTVRRAAVSAPAAAAIRATC